MRRGLTIFLEGLRLEGLRLEGLRSQGLRSEGLRAASGPARAPGEGVAALSARVAKAWREDLLAGYRQDPSTILRPLRTRSAEDLVAVREIEFSSICMHHLLPFHGRVHVAYAPAGRITGLSRLGRLVDCLSRRLQLQETLTRQIADAIQEHLSPEGAACLIEATHTCMAMRGARRSHSRIVTAAFTGIFRRSPARRREILAMLAVRPSRRG